ncbi:SAM-dependent methyltransferase [Nocardiopsis trehalosi]|jgi:SAM-dependent methyltransferase|uniref:SAM-dependent methyltransferase n=1 Tax=Nocardiopsis trehalosi TaxID=109329 RepID=UPI00082CEC7C|nr:class I SAM-dependent methyltransferase [Nocardiopsis trehalosi]
MTDTTAANTYSGLDFNAPLSDARARRLADRVAAAGPGTVADLGCGWGELLLRALESCPAATGTGVDTDDRLLQRARAAAERRGLADRAEFTAGPADAVRGPFDAVLCVGADHALGGTAPALRALSGVVAPGGTVVFGTAVWERTPTAGELAAMWPGATADELPATADVVDAALDAGFRPAWIESANGDEWDAFESGYLSDWERRAAACADPAEAAALRARADTARGWWLRGFRGVMGFCYLTLTAPAG